MIVLVHNDFWLTLWLKTPHQKQDALPFSELLKYQAPQDFEKETWTMNAEEKAELIPKLKEAGNQLYKEKRYSEATDKYAEALGLLEQLAML